MGQNAPSGGDAVNLKTGKKAPRHRSTYDLSYRFANTVRYGFVSPFFKFEGIEGDKVSLRSGHNLRTLSLKSPLFQNLRMNKDFYAVPLKALLPYNWDKIHNNPVQGDDVPAWRLNTVLTARVGPQDSSVYGNLSHLIQGIAKYYSNITGASGKYTEDFERFMHFLCLVNIFMGRDSLFNQFRIDLFSESRGTAAMSPEDLCRKVWSLYHTLCNDWVTVLKGKDLKPVMSIAYQTDLGTIICTKDYDLSISKERVRMFYDILESPLFLLNNIKSYGDPAAFPIAALDEVINKSTLDSYLLQLRWNQSKDDGVYINVAPVYAYQMIIREYFTNDKIDYIYNSDMWRSFIYASCESYATNASDKYFTWNYVKYPYDAFSNATIGKLFYKLYSVGGSITGQAKDRALLITLCQELFGIQRNLKYVDYFTGARSRPIAIGDLNVAVGDNGVDIIDISKNIQKQRFLNQVNRVGPDAKNYLKGIFGVEERQHIDVPVKIGHIDETIYGEEVQNTATEQMNDPNSITTNLKSRGSNFAFEFKVSECTIVLGLCSFSIRRFYNGGVDPFSRKVDRFDQFNPYLQFVGDQPIYLDELQSGNDKTDIFGYTGRYAEYKNSVDYACGAFLEELNSWIFSDPSSAKRRKAGEHSVYHVCPEFIRQDPTEIDDYYLNMTGDNPQDRYHFIVVFDNKVEATRNMVFNPQILG